MKIFSVALVAGLLILGGCSEKAAVNKAEAAVPVATAKEPTPEEKFAVTKKKADAGDAVAQNELGDMYGYGVGLPKDLTKAVEWYQRAAAQGNADAQFTLGWWYAMGDGLPKDRAKAVEWYQKAAAQGHADAQDNLSRLYLRENLVLAYAWSNLAAAQGNDGAKYTRDICGMYLMPAKLAEAQHLASNWKKGEILQASSDNASGSTRYKITTAILRQQERSASIKNTASSIAPDAKHSKQGTGTAFVISSAGHALTNHHIINGCTEVKIAGREGIAKVITSDSVNDLALLQLPGTSKYVAALNPDLGKLRQGEDIIVFGYPLEWALSSGGNLTSGTLSALTGLANNTNQIQITAPIQPGSSGSPVMDKKGNVVGVVSMKLDDGKMARTTGQVGQNVNFAVNGQTVKAFLDANKVPYKTGGGFFSREKSNADVAEEASKWTVLAECWK